ncbi:YslB family protein [Pullulanibacillus sp. KACC 23026]|uniref:YslB family protein n=1 Tax=Pullulanibacillus sp. KACC 23026 TaxID=3028315 RepID=UPI0023B10E5A|nr:YslB family protein [Pullulanibacillus sp. KACC 23026]WEG13946.1 YslB family protein [Pullulanibacillus sp. KACC 23026]
MEKRLPQIEVIGNTNVSAFGLELLRTVVIPELLGDETHPILYWAGRRLARQYPLQDVADLPAFFEKAGWGQLELKESKKDHCLYFLTSELIEARIKDDEHTTFSLETGFLAEQYERLTQYKAEAIMEVKTGKQKRAEIQIQWDLKDPVEKKSE